MEKKNGQNNKVKQIRPEECVHSWSEISQDHKSDEIEIRLQCDKCGVVSVEIYRFSEGYVLNSEGDRVDKFYK